LQDLAFGFDSARTRHHDEIVAANLNVPHLHHAARTRVGFGDKIETGELSVPLGIHERGHSSNPQTANH